MIVGVIPSSKLVVSNAEEPPVGRPIPCSRSVRLHASRILSSAWKNCYGNPLPSSMLVHCLWERKVQGIPSYGASHGSFVTPSPYNLGLVTIEQATWPQSLFWNQQLWTSQCSRHWTSLHSNANMVRPKNASLEHPNPCFCVCRTFAHIILTLLC